MKFMMMQKLACLKRVKTTPHRSSSAFINNGNKRFNNFLCCAQQRFYARRISKDELSQHQQEESQQQIQQQLKYVRDYELELSDDIKKSLQSSTINIDDLENYYEDEMDEFDEIDVSSEEIKKYEESETEPNITTLKDFEAAWDLRASTKYRTGRPTLQEYIDLLRNDLAQDMIVMNLSTKCTFASYAIYVTGTSYRHMKMMAQHVVDLLKQRKMFYLNPCIEGEKSEMWMVVDCGDLYVHIFSQEGRDYYDVERKWAFQKVEQYEPLAALSAQNLTDSEITLEDEEGTYSVQVEKAKE